MITRSRLDKLKERIKSISNVSNVATQTLSQLMSWCSMRALHLAMKLEAKSILMKMDLEQEVQPVSSGSSEPEVIANDDPELIAAMFKLLVESGCLWQSVEYCGVREVNFRDIGKKDVVTVQGKTKEHKTVMVMKPVDSNNIILVEPS